MNDSREAKQDYYPQHEYRIGGVGHVCGDGGSSTICLASPGQPGAFMNHYTNKSYICQDGVTFQGANFKS